MEEEVGVGVWRQCPVEVNPGADPRGISNMSRLMRRRRRRGEEEEEEEKRRSMLGRWRRRSKRRRKHSMGSGRDGCSS